jgi:hypothetical protein
VTDTGGVILKRVLGRVPSSHVLDDQHRRLIAVVIPNTDHRSVRRPR